MPEHEKTAILVTKAGERKEVTYDQILQAMRKLDDSGKVPVRKCGWFVVKDGKQYPPKWLIKLATGDLLKEFRGIEARKTLADLGFDPREVDKTDEADEADDLNETNGQAAALKFGLERDLQDTLRKNIGQLEAELKIIDGGKEQVVGSGRIDITAEDRNDATVVIELKAGKAGRHAIGQILAYMGDLSQGKKPVRGILVAETFSPQAIAAALAVPNLQLKSYSVTFDFKSPGSRS